MTQAATSGRTPALARANAQHKRLVTLLRRKDTGRAVRLMREHCEGTEHILAALMPDW